MDALVEIRVLGPLRVRTGGGEVIETAAWRTAKTRHLVRLLALSAGELVPAEALIDALWPEVAPQRGRASLRTAVSLVRHRVGEAHVLRRAGGLALVGTWVDAKAVEGQADAIRQHVADGRRVETVRAVWEAAHLYTGDLCADEPYAEWALAHRERYRRLAHELLLEGAEAALALTWLRDARQLGDRALRLDPSSERAYRVLMRTYGHLGETHVALGLYDRCRRTLAEQLGADPAPETQELHLELLRPASTPAVAPRFVGRERPVRSLAQAMTSVVEEGRPRYVVLTGPRGSGRTRCAEEVARQWPGRVVTVRCSERTPVPVPPLPPPPGSTTATAARVPDAAALRALVAESPVLLVLDDVDAADRRSVAALDALLGQVDGALLVLATAGDDQQGAQDVLLSQPLWEHLVLPPLVLEEVAELLRSVLGCAPSGELVEELAAEQAHTPKALVGRARALRAGGELLATASGMRRVPRQTDLEPGQADDLLSRARAQVDAEGNAAIDLLAVLDRSTTRGELARLLAVEERTVAGLLGTLEDLGVVQQEGVGYRLRDLLVRESAYSWLRPSTRRTLHRLVAENARLPTAERIEHWLHCAEPTLACAAALEAADQALVRGDDVHVRAHLLRVMEFAEEQAVGVEDRIGLREQLAQAALRLGRPHEAQQRLEEAVALARAQAPHALGRLHAAQGQLAGTAQEALDLYERAARCSGTDGPAQGRISVLAAAASARSDPEGGTSVLQGAVDAADAGHDVDAQVATRVLLSRASAQRRDVAAARDAAQAALTLALETGSELLFARAAHALAVTPAYLGHGRREEALLQRAVSAAVAAQDADVTCAVRLTHCLVLHDLGSPDFARAWEGVCSSGQRPGQRRLHRIVDALVSLERGYEERTARLLDELPRRSASALSDHATQIVHARLRERRGDVAGAVRALSSVLDDPRAATTTLLVPEAGAHLAELLADVDLARARRALTAARVAAGDDVHPREQVRLLRAQAALLTAAGDPDAGASVASSAALAARGAGLRFQQAEALALRARLLDVAGAGARAARGRAAAVTVFLRAGAPLRAAGLRGRVDEAARASWTEGTGA